MRWPDAIRRLRETARLMVGVPDYEAFAAHRRARHPDEPVPSRADFQRLCAERRFAGEPGKGSGCC
jgi:uncharacterized short protein YbdD (DUF466 family)